jgi:hypothetical protein
VPLLSDRAREAAEDVFFGQVVMIWARWTMIGAAAILFFWNPTDVGALTGRVLLLAGLMAINFFLHGRYLVERPAGRLLLGLASVADVALIAASVVLWGGFASQLFVLLYPVLFAFALVFPPRFSAALTFVALALYVGALLIGDLSWLGDVQQLKTLAVRLLTISAMAGLGTYYWRIQRDRRRAALAAALGR